MGQISFREANSRDLAKIIQLVETHDEDDAEAIHESLEVVQFENHFVALLDEIEVIGVTGFHQQPDCDHTFYLSWTYLHKDYCGKGYGNSLMEYILEQLKLREARKVFIKVSDYVDEEGIGTYAAAMSLYKKFGFMEELKLENYYDKDESMCILGLRLKPEEERPQIKEEKPALKFTGMYKISETEYSYSFSWESAKWWKGSFGVSEIQIGLDAAYDDGAHRVVLSFPATYIKVNNILLNAGFEIIGNLKDYYEDGIDEVHYQYQFVK
ncbi:GNAT family N-acetyltransferase [Aliikangiella sp. IMCC44359]|uniref:GNAT family N-acetyltransferase n=1 Tax=Aliikangiella sp. IMCC44359 TaxID=3459125 RepID=UPI00403ACFCD